MGEKSRRKREERARQAALKRLAEKNRAGRKVVTGARARVSVGGREVGIVNSIEYGIPTMPSMSGEVKWTFKIVESREDLEKRLALAEARARDLEAVLGDRLEEQGMPRSPMLARLAKVPDIEKGLQALYRMGIGHQMPNSRLFGITEPSCCPPHHITYGPTVHDADCPLQAALLVLGGAEEEKRREIEFQRRMALEVARGGRRGAEIMYMSHIDYQVTPAVPPPGEPPHD